MLIMFIKIPDCEIVYRLREDSIEIDCAYKDKVYTTTIEDSSRFKEAQAYLERLLFGINNNIPLRTPRGVTYTSLKPTTGGITFTRTEDKEVYDSGK